jgi:glutamyl-tRNA synthetase
MPTLVRHFRAYLNENKSPVAAADDAMLERILKMNEGARTLEQVEQKTRFAFVADAAFDYDPAAVSKILLKSDGLAILAEVGRRLAALKDITPDSIEAMLRQLAEEKQVGLGKVAQPLRVAITGTTVSPPIFEAVEMLGLSRTLARIERTLKQFQQG